MHYSNPHAHTDKSCYAYTADLLALASHTNPSPPTLPHQLSVITTRLNLDAWELWLNYHPDAAYTHYILDGITNGFCIGFSYAERTCTSSKRNQPSANEHPTVISEALAKETSAGRLFGPLNPGDYPFVHISSLGAVPKKHSH